MQRIGRQLIIQARSHVARSRLDQRQMCSGSPYPKAKLYSVGRTHEYIMKNIAGINMILCVVLVAAIVAGRSMETKLLIAETRVAAAIEKLEKLRRETKSEFERPQTAAEELANEYQVKHKHLEEYGLRKPASSDHPNQLLLSC
jgi:ABC-type transport system involved in cytochrome bd biosynthesis fused ATPase/permease subunit